MRVLDRPWVHRYIRSLKRGNAKLALLGLYQQYVNANAPADLYVVPGETIAYVGFYRPEYAEALVRAVGPKGRVVLVEADPRNYARLVEGIETIRGKEQVETVNRAIWREGGLVSFEVYDDEGHEEFNKIGITNAQAFYGNATRTIEVPAITFDEVFDTYPEIRHVFITINGAELEAIKGMNRYFSTPGCSAWIKSPFVDRVTNEPMLRQLIRELRSLDLRVFQCRHGDMRDRGGKVFAYRSF